MNVKLIEKKIRELLDEKNPHIDVAQQTTELQISDFSFEDKMRAQRLLDIEKYQANSNYKARKAVKQIDLYAGKSANIHNEYGNENIVISIPV